MKKLFILCVCALMAMTIQAQSFVKGVSNYKVLKCVDDPYNNGITFAYSGRNIKVDFYYRQTGYVARIQEESGKKKYMDYYDPFEIGERDLTTEEYDKMEYEITQYDFDGDSVDEIVIVSRIYNGASMPVGVFVYRLKDGKTWNVIAPQTWWDMKVQLVNKHIKVEANHYGFTYDWIYENGKFVDKGNY